MSSVNMHTHLLIDTASPVLCFTQIMYSLLYRAPETNGVMEACKENGVTPIAYSPLGLGLLTGRW